jgi:hypothetical protein
VSPGERHPERSGFEVRIPDTLLWSGRATQTQAASTGRATRTPRARLGKHATPATDRRAWTSGASAAFAASSAARSKAARGATRGSPVGEERSRGATRRDGAPSRRGSGRPSDIGRGRIGLQRRLQRTPSKASPRAGSPRCTTSRNGPGLERVSAAHSGIDRWKTAQNRWD